MLPSVSLTLALTPLHTNMRTHTHSASLPVRMMSLVLRSAPPVSDGAQDWPKWASLLEEHLLHLSLKILPFNQTWAWMLFHTHRIGSVPELTAILVSRTTKTFPVSRRWWKTTLRLLFLRTNLTILQLACTNATLIILWFPDLQAGLSYLPPDCCEVVPMTTLLGGCKDKRLHI